ncbi:MULTISPECIES: pyridoxamine 5'-phosphate oxidase [Methylobacterium]|uniref:Pyridoxine/pyridoxamine 5'-phosphate oxidase n=2 Tax=Methylobacterium TaxID=407 RepID=A0A0C6F7K1_9HYPH|nr:MULTISPECIES: pyridoxamine 5'-phosphate oxidase [Methylobacterium]MBZ6412953.1 pyridoxamine 5'-phosphate oxidase [Methylobacterium sp.]MBK3395443.1 pyridoxamine 5'-phosphate oxidase [Methylobacterium ajmalii]MBK3410869.1 pyridoxamine 5'-phosphate oxidase [Methylobacterium ajmalii]MBK3422442.1 pyridoxamine 5'-phosphate oxidase [Methylobacterium ajmalii]SFE97497.1 Pyridoxamine 5'-phosphate oxidase [Methylobacterium sp. yr596]
MDGLTKGDFTQNPDPWDLFRQWFADAQVSEPEDPNAMALATSGADGMPDVRIVLLKDADERGFVFYTNTLSMKGQELADNPQAALVMHWKSLRRQVRARGTVTKVSEAEADAYYASRPRDSRLGAWASRQSQPLESRDVLIRAVDEMRARFPDEAVPRPPHWTGYRIAPVTMEFWQDGAYRLHDRVRFTREGEAWTGNRLYP